MKLQLTQQIIVNDRHKYYAGLDHICLLAKNLYNVALFNIRQQYFKDKTYLNTLIVGKNNGWKANIELGKVNNQNFVSILYNMLISMLEYKCKMHGIKMITVNEAYTSKCSFLDSETICKSI